MLPPCNPNHQWPSDSFWHQIDNAISEDNCLPILANIPREQLVQAYLQGWLMLWWPAGNA